jgi:hypothetical protein
MKIPWFVKSGGITEVPKGSAKKFGMRYSRIFKCACGTQMVIHAADPRDDLPSNFEGVKPTGHSNVPAHALNWKGLAEERGWKTDPKIVCPACQRGLSLAEFKRLRRTGQL